MCGPIFAESSDTAVRDRVKDREYQRARGYDVASVEQTREQQAAASREQGPTNERHIHGFEPEGQLAMA